jgi:hypothetical protein
LPGRELRLVVTQRLGFAAFARGDGKNALENLPPLRPDRDAVKHLAAIESMSSIIRQYIWLFVAKLIEGVGLQP